MARKPDDVQVLVRNRKARHEYFIDETVEAGVALAGSEVKSLRAAQGNLNEAWAECRNGEVFLVGMHVGPWPFAHQRGHEPLRARKLLLHRREIDKLDAKTAQKGLTLVPLELYLKGGRIKVAIGVARGKKQWDKRDSERERTERREAESAIRRSR